MFSEFLSCRVEATAKNFGKVLQPTVFFYKPSIRLDGCDGVSILLHGPFFEDSFIKTILAL
jgi:hypothetical protein